MTVHDISRFTLEALQTAGITVEPVDGGRAYQGVVTRTDLWQVLQRRTLHFTFDEEYFDLHRDGDVEYVAPGYPLLDALIRLTRARFTVSEAVVPARSSTAALLSGQDLQLEIQRRGTFRPYLRFHVRVVYQSDAYEEEILQIVVDPQTNQTLPKGATQWTLEAVQPGHEPLLTSPTEGLIQGAWTAVETEIQSLVSASVARHEEMANARLYREQSNLEKYLLQTGARATPGGQRRLKELTERYRLTVKMDLIFAEVIHYPFELVRGRATRTHPRTAKVWNTAVQYDVDRVTGRVDNRPACPVCQTPLNVFAPCDAGTHLVCATCSTACSTCGAFHCGHHPLDSCGVKGCGSGHCPECLEQCARCGDGACAQSCTAPCPECGDTVCTDCTGVCADCEYLACTGHFRACHLTGTLLCAEHAVSCTGCGQPTRGERTRAVTRTSGATEPVCDGCVRACEISGVPHHPADLIVCHETRRSISPKYAHTCARCSHVVAVDTVLVTARGEDLCPSCTADCLTCQATHSLDDLVACSTPHGHSAHLCPEHRHRCVDCPPGTVYCDAHTDSCSECHACVCGKHAGHSHLSGAVLCQTHAVSCRQCKRTVAPNELRSVTAPNGGPTVEVCTACTTTCTVCGPERLYARKHLWACASGANHGAHHVCPPHALKCAVCNQVGCPGHSAACADCGKRTCEAHTSRLPDGTPLCVDCTGTCPECPPGTPHRLSAMRVCASCRTTVCGEHARRCADCDRVLCATHATMTRQGQMVCPDHAGHCPSCPPGVVHRTRRLHSCGECGTHVCDEHVRRCADCDRVLCATHAVMTWEGQVVCSEHVAHCSLEECHPSTPHRLSSMHACSVCRSLVCNRHLRRCADCNAAVCTDHAVMTRQGQTVCPEHAGGCVSCPPGVVHRVRSLQSCGECGAHVCAAHVRRCVDCDKVLCTAHATVTRQGESVCPQHVGHCSSCPPEVAHRARRLQTCADCGTHVCDRHAHTVSDVPGTGQGEVSNVHAVVCSKHLGSCVRCRRPKPMRVSALTRCVGGELLCNDCHAPCRRCRAPHCPDHARRCRMCGGGYCVSCTGYRDLCPTCNSLREVPQGDAFRADLPALQALGVSVSTEPGADLKAARDGSSIHLYYVPASKGFVASLLHRVFPLPPRVAVLEKRDGRYHLVSDEAVTTQ